MNCTTCDAPLEAGALFCANCGARVEQPAAQPSYPTQPQAAPQPTYPAQSYGSQSSPGVPQPYAPPQPYMPPQPVYAPMAQPNSTAAILSLVFGILSWVGLVFIGAIVAIIAGHMARKEINNSGGQIGGAGMALAGLILGYSNLIVSLLACVGFFLLFLIGAAAN